MIERVSISNLGVIESAELTLTQMMTAITGETGAGKTMALTSLALLMGHKADPSRVRNGAEFAQVDGVFLAAVDSPVVSLVTGAGGQVDIEDNKAIIYVSRVIPSRGRSRAYAGGKAVPASLLATIAEHLVTVHGQSDQIRLKSQSAQLESLDAFGGEQLQESRRAYDEAWTAAKIARDALKAFRQDARASGLERLSLEALVKRVETLDPHEGEEETLRSEAIKLENIESLREAMGGAVKALDDVQDGALSRLDFARHELQRASVDDTTLSQLATELANSMSTVADIAAHVRSKISELSADPERLNKIHARRADLTRLQRDLAMTIPEVLAERDRAVARLQALVDPDIMEEELEGNYNAAVAKLKDAGFALRAQREHAAVKLSKLVTRELHSLAMKDATFNIRLKPREKPAPHGLEDCEFLLQPHRGSPALPLATSASGGEMSRIMLALEVSLATQSHEGERTFIFDEVDAGIGGSTAITVGERLAKLGQHHQVLVVTHLAQVAAYAHCQVVVRKSMSATVSTDVRITNGEERVIELARMLSGQPDSEAARAHAAELLAGAIVP
ncbi:DNA repair protein RecN [Arcanobacterium canis]